MNELTLVLATLTLTLTDPHHAFQRFCAPVFCDFLRNFSCTVDGAIYTPFKDAAR